jgi:negative regulator of flagellin synthesis FlgM
MRKQPIGGKMKISGTNMNHQQLAMTQNTKTKVEQAPAKASQSIASEPEMAALREAQTQLNGMADVDMDKVIEIKAAIKEGRISLDPEKIAQAMLKYHQG